MIEMKHVNKTYPNGYQALKDVNLNIQQGEYVAVIGLSGAGKSTLIRTINRMIPITEGTLKVDDQDVTALRGKALRSFRRRIGMIFQSFNLVTRTKVISNVLAARVPDLPWWRSLFGIFPQKDVMDALETLDQMGIADKAYTRVDQLSGGQQQRVAIARALAMNPDILFFDEPTSALDPELTAEILKVIRQLAEEHMTMVIVTHEINFARNVSDRIVFMADGVIVEQGRADQLIDNPQNERTRSFLANIGKGRD